MQSPIPNGPNNSAGIPLSGFDASLFNEMAKFGIGVNVADPRFGGSGNGANDETLAVVRAILSLPQTGGDVFFGSTPQNLSVGILATKWNILGDLSAAINTKQYVRFRGCNPRSARGNFFPPYPALTTLYLKNRTDYLFTLSAASVTQAICFQDIAIDFSNGGGTAQGSTTAPGVIANGSNVTATIQNFTADNVICTDTSYGHSSLAVVGGIGNGFGGRAVFDLDFSLSTIIKNCFMGDCQNGRLFFTDNGSTTFSVENSHFTGCREVYYHRNTYKARYENCIFDSCVTIGAQYLSNVHHTDSYAENIGQNTGTANWTTGLAPRNHGIGGGVGALLAGNINTAINQLYGSLVLDIPNLQSLNDVPFTAWMECLGVASGSGSGGTLTIRNPRKNDAGLTDTLFSATMAFTATERGHDFYVHLEEDWGISPTGKAIVKSGDMRMVNSGMLTVNFNDGTAFRCSIKRGRYVMDLSDQTQSLGAAPTSYPRNDQNQVGDMIMVPAPAASGNIGLVCTTAGQPGTWKTFGAIAP